VDDAADAERIATEAIEISRQHRFPQWLGFAQQWRGWALCRLGDVADGLALLDEGLRRMRETGTVLHTTMGGCLFADALLLAGKPAAALGHLEAAQSHAEGYGERYLAAEIHRLRAEARRAEGGCARECEGHLREALAVARGQGARLLELRAARDLARLRRDQGRVAEARDLLAPVYAAFTEGFAFPDLVEARALLEELGAAPEAARTGATNKRSGRLAVPIVAASPSPAADGTCRSEAAFGPHPCSGSSRRFSNSSFTWLPPRSGAGSAAGRGASSRPRAPTQDQKSLFSRFASPAAWDRPGAVHEGGPRETRRGSASAGRRCCIRLRRPTNNGRDLDRQAITCAARCLVPRVGTARRPASIHTALAMGPGEFQVATT
jgi:hypothetical protein